LGASIGLPVTKICRLGNNSHRALSSLNFLNLKGYPFSLAHLERHGTPEHFHVKVPHYFVTSSNELANRNKTNLKGRQCRKIHFR